MRKWLPMLAIAAALAPPLDAQVVRRLPPARVPPVRSEAPPASVPPVRGEAPPSRLPPVRSEAPPAPVPPVLGELPTTQAPPVAGAPFAVACVAITALSSYGFEFWCRKADGTTLSMSVARVADRVGHGGSSLQESAYNGTQDAQTATEFSQTVVAFLLYKTLRPASHATLRIYGFYSELPAKNAAPVATRADFEAD